MEKKLGSLFDGIGGFPLAAKRNGIRPVWASEIEKFPMAVTMYRFPEMKHMGDITKLHGENLPVVDVIAGGSPCQDLSIAGRRAGLAGMRSGLFLEQVRIIKEMRRQEERRKNSSGRRADVPVRPRYMVWENVPGAFSSGEPKGADFKRVLEEVCGISEESVSLPGPPDGAWTPAGIILGQEFSVAWRVLDAQFWGVPQRRRRIFLIADFGGHSAGEILFESESVWRHYQESREQRKKAAVDLLYRQSNVEELLKAENFSQFSLDYYSDSLTSTGTPLTSREAAAAALEKSQAFVRNFGSSFENLFFYGDTGVGKTFLSHCIARELIEQSFCVIYFTAFDLFDLFARYTFSSSEEAKDAHANIFDCDLLIIDDLGTELTNSFVSSQLFLCINERILRKKSTIISTNLPLDRFMETYSERTFSRISSNYTIIKLFGNDIRIQKKLLGGTKA